MTFLNFYFFMTAALHFGLGPELLTSKVGTFLVLLQTEVKSYLQQVRCELFITLKNPSNPTSAHLNYPFKRSVLKQRQRIISVAHSCTFKHSTCQSGQQGHGKMWWCTISQESSQLRRIFVLDTENLCFISIGEEMGPGEVRVDLHLSRAALPRHQRLFTALCHRLLM